MNDKNNNDPYSYHYSYTNQQRPGPGPGTPPRPQPSSDRRGSSDLGSWIFDVVMLFVFPPLGLLLTVSHALGTDIFKKLFSGRGTRQASYSSHYASQRGSRAGGQTASSRVYTSPGSQPGAASRPEPAADAPAGGDVRRYRPADAGSSALNVFGWILVAFGVIAAIGSSGAVWTLITALCVALGGGAMLLKSLTNRRKARAFARCVTVSGTEGLVNIGQLAATLGMKSNELDRQLTEMIDRGYYGPKAYIDHQRGLLVIDPEDMRDVYRREDEAKKTRAQREQEAQQSEYERIIAAIRQADEDIDDEAMSEKIRRMQTLTAAIFKEVEEHPEKKSQITRFMNYYLPTTLKLLNSYARIEEQGVTGENMAKAKADIEGIADTLVDGYEKQLDTLYRAEAIDIAGDVRVIEQMLRSDGLADTASPFRNTPEPGEAAGQTMGGH